MTPKIKKQKDLWDTFRAIQKKHCDGLSGSPKILGFAMANIEWEGYTTALFEFGVINENDYKEIMAWRTL